LLFLHSTPWCPAMPRPLLVGSAELRSKISQKSPWCRCCCDTAKGVNSNLRPGSMCQILVLPRQPMTANDSQSGQVSEKRCLGILILPWWNKSSLKTLTMLRLKNG
jgi:hypothetical protein